MKNTLRPKDAFFSTYSSFGGGFWSILVCFGVILCLFFFRSFDPDLILFSNDGPLGQENAASIRAPSCFTGVWLDLNSLGNNAGAPSFQPTWLFLWWLGPLYCSKFFVPIALLFL